MSDFEDQIRIYLSVQMPEAGAITLQSVARISGGASRQTYRVRISTERQGERGLIVRRDPESTLIETDRAIEFAAFRSFEGSDVPVPRALFLEPDPKWLDRPFFVMEEIVGGSPAQAFAVDPYGVNREKVGEQLFSILGRIAARDLATAELSKHAEAPAPAETWSRELAYWEAVIDEDELEPQPIVRAAIRWLRRNPPPPAQRISIVHGDYRSGNFLADGEGKITAILDWEMAHLGDPLEDLGWVLDPLWAHHNPAVPAGTLPTERAIALWEAASGLTVDKTALDWWTMFAAVKGMAIWISSAQEYASGTNIEPVMAGSALYCGPFHDLVLANRLATLGGLR